MIAKLGRVIHHLIHHGFVQHLYEVLHEDVACQFDDLAVKLKFRFHRVKE